MNGYGLPSLNIRVISRITPSRYYAFRSCNLKGILAACGHPALLPSSPAAHIGSVVHKIIEKAHKGIAQTEAEFAEAWAKEIQDHENLMASNPLESHLVPLEETANDYEVKRLMALKMIRSLSASGSTPESGFQRSCAEEWLETRDKKIAGRVDLVQETSKGIIIIDYKTGAIIDERNNGPKEEYKLQLKLYAALYHEKYNEWVQKLILAGIDDSMHEVAFSQSECIDLLEQAKRLIDDTNVLITSGCPAREFAGPSPEACRYCCFRPGCQKYWEVRQDTDEWPTDVMGVIKEKGICGNRLGRVVVERGGREYRVRGLSDRHRFLADTCTSVLLCDLAKDKAPDSFMERMITTSMGF